MLVGSECTSAQEQSSVRTLCCCRATGEAEGALMTWWRCVFSSVTSTKGACRVWVESKQDNNNKTKSKNALTSIHAAMLSPGIGLGTD